jgi:hypothetical protein
MIKIRAVAPQLQSTIYSQKEKEKMPFAFEKLNVYKKAVNFAENISVQTSNFPKDFTFFLITQKKRHPYQLIVWMPVINLTRPSSSDKSVYRLKP